MAQFDIWDSKLDKVPGVMDFDMPGGEYDIEISVCEEDDLDMIQAKLLAILGEHQ